MVDPNKNGENYDKNNRWVWIIIVLITLSSIYVMSKIYSDTLAVSVVNLSFLSNSLSLL